MRTPTIGGVEQERTYAQCVVCERRENRVQTVLVVSLSRCPSPPDALFVVFLAF